MRFLKLAAVLLIACTSSVHATIVVLSSNPDPAIGRVALDASQNVLPNGSQFLIGTFATPGNISLLNSVAAIQAAGGWSQFDGALSISTAGGTSPGKVTGQATDNNNPTASPFNNKPLYIMIFNTSSAATATQVGIFRAPSAVTPWTFPTNLGGLGDTLTISVDDASAVAIGGVGSVSISPSRFVLSALVPEPSAVALLIPSVIGLFGCRRFRRAS